MAITAKDLRQAIVAHNDRKEDASFNDNYNIVAGLGSRAARNLVSKCMKDTHGLMGFHIVSKKEIKYWAKEQTDLTDSELEAIEKL